MINKQIRINTLIFHQGNHISLGWVTYCWSLCSLLLMAVGDNHLYKEYCNGVTKIYRLGEGEGGSGVPGNCLFFQIKWKIPKTENQRAIFSQDWCCLASTPIYCVLHILCSEMTCSLWWRQMTFEWLQIRHRWRQITKLGTIMAAL